VALGPDASDGAVFDALAGPPLDWLWRGFNATVLGLGDTGAGKTSTLLGERWSSGGAASSGCGSGDSGSGRRSSSAGGSGGVLGEVLRRLFARVGEASGMQPRGAASHVVGISAWEVLGSRVVDLLDSGKSGREMSPAPSAPASPGPFLAVQAASAAEAFRVVSAALRASANWAPDNGGRGDRAAWDDDLDDDAAALLPLAPRPNRSHLFVRLCLLDVRSGGGNGGVLSTLHLVDTAGTPCGSGSGGSGGGGGSSSSNGGKCGGGGGEVTRSEALRQLRRSNGEAVRALHGVLEHLGRSEARAQASRGSSGKGGRHTGKSGGGGGDGVDSALLSARDHRLTQVLAPLLAGNARTWLLCGVAAGSGDGPQNCSSDGDSGSCTARFAATQRSLVAAVAGSRVQAACGKLRGVTAAALGLIPTSAALAALAEARRGCMGAALSAAALAAVPPVAVARHHRVDRSAAPAPPLPQAEASGSHGGGENDCYDDDTFEPAEDTLNTSQAAARTPLRSHQTQQQQQKRPQSTHPGALLAAARTPCRSGAPSPVGSATNDTPGGGATPSSPGAAADVIRSRFLTGSTHKIAKIQSEIARVVESLLPPHERTFDHRLCEAEDEHGELRDTVDGTAEGVADGTADGAADGDGKDEVPSDGNGHGGAGPASGWAAGAAVADPPAAARASAPFLLSLALGDALSEDPAGLSLGLSLEALAGDGNLGGRGGAGQGGGVLEGEPFRGKHEKHAPVQQEPVPATDEAKDQTNDRAVKGKDAAEDDDEPIWPTSPERAGAPTPPLAHASELARPSRSPGGGLPELLSLPLSPSPGRGDGGGFGGGGGGGGLGGGALSLLALADMSANGPVEVPWFAESDEEAGSVGLGDVAEVEAYAEEAYAEEEEARQADDDFEAGAFEVRSWAGEAAGEAVGETAAAVVDNRGEEGYGPGNGGGVAKGSEVAGLEAALAEERRRRSAAEARADAVAEAAAEEALAAAAESGGLKAQVLELGRRCRRLAVGASGSGASDVGGGEALSVYAELEDEARRLRFMLAEAQARLAELELSAEGDEDELGGGSENGDRRCSPLRPVMAEPGAPPRPASLERCNRSWSQQQQQQQQQQQSNQSRSQLSQTRSHSQALSSKPGGVFAAGGKPMRGAAAARTAAAAEEDRAMIERLRAAVAAARRHADGAKRAEREAKGRAARAEAEATSLRGLKRAAASARGVAEAGQRRFDDLSREVS